ncbi:MAG: DUF1080 domain-containing protein [Bacteroidetes bacterium]|nr:DUF1080 domain-containing protein [Bacteroidota bacterium]
MKMILRVLIVGFVSGSLLPAQTASAQKQKLFNGKDLEGWDTYLGPSYDSLKKSFDTLKVIGLNKDPRKVFSVVDVDGQPALRISGENFGGISTQQAYSNYHLKLEFKWGKKKWPPRKDKPRDSGLLYHAAGKHGADFGFWMRSQEFQIEEGNCGDYWGVAGGSFEITAKKNKEGFIFDHASPKLVFNEKSANGRWCIKQRNAEKPSGEWNTVEIYCIGDTAFHLVNGVVVMILNHSSQLNNGELVPLYDGKIQLQSEGAEVFYRNIELESIKKFPMELLQLN